MITMFLTIFQRFPTALRRFPKILEKQSDGHTNFNEHCAKISDDEVSFKLHHNLSTVYGSNMIFNVNVTVSILPQ